MAVIDVACAVLVRDGKFLACQRRADSEQSLLWEFPGGKVEEGETYEQCILREIKEELGVEIIIEKSLQPVEYHYPNRTIRLIPFLGFIPHGEPVLHAHHAFVWISTARLSDLDWSNADRALIERNQLKYTFQP